MMSQLPSGRWATVGAPVRSPPSAWPLDPVTNTGIWPLRVTRSGALPAPTAGADHVCRWILRHGRTMPFASSTMSCTNPLRPRAVAVTRPVAGQPEVRRPR